MNKDAFVESNLREYEGSELELFANANTWKSYFSNQLTAYIHGDVAEIGSGIGSNTSFFLESNFKSWTCVEPDSNLCLEIKKRFDKLGHSINVVNDFSSSLQDEAYDTLIYLDVLEHIENDSAEVKVAWDKLRVGGRLVTLSPAFQYFYSDFDKAIGHFRRYNKSTLRKIVDPAEYEEVEMYYLDSIGVFASLANKWFLKQSNPTVEQVKMWDSKIVPISKIFDKVFSPFFGKSIVGVWQKK